MRHLGITNKLRYYVDVYALNSCIINLLFIMILQARVVTVKLGYRRSKQNRPDV